MFYSSELLSLLVSLYITVILRKRLIDLTYMWNVKRNGNARNRIRLTDREQTGDSSGEWRGLCEQGAGAERCDQQLQSHPGHVKCSVGSAVGNIVVTVCGAVGTLSEAYAMPHT